MAMPNKPVANDLVRDEAVIVALGANDKGKRDSCLSGLEAAVAALKAAGLEILGQSSWWQSAAWPDPNDPPFLNGVIVVKTELSPKALMAELSRIEDELGRVRSVRNAPRTLDLDLIAYGRVAADLDGLLLPHPRAAERLFVMGPLAEVMPDWVHPVLNRPAEALARGATVGVDARPL